MIAFPRRSGAPSARPRRSRALYSAVLPILAALALSAAFLGCLGGGGGGGGGGGTETEYDVVSGRLVTAEDVPVQGALVEARPADYLTDPISSDRADSAVQSTYTDRQGAYRIKGLPPGRYRFAFSAALDTIGAIRDTVMNKTREGIDLGKDVLLPRGSISGSILPDSESQGSGFVQVFGIEQFVFTDAMGHFTVFLPQGVYDIRLSSRQPFRREKILYGIPVVAGQQTNLAPVALEKEAKLAYRVDSLAGLQILGLDSTNPVIFDNELWDNGPDNEYIWAKASIGALKLRGNIVTRDFHGGSPMEEQLMKARQQLWEDRAAGFANIPDMTPGANAPMAWPSTGDLDDITPIRSAGSDLIVAEARKATPEKPLLVVVGGPLTTVAQAWASDHSIATRMIVAGIYTYKMQPDDTVANYLVARKCRFLQWGRDYVWAGKPDTSLIKTIPSGVMGERIRTYLRNNTKFLPFGDLAPVGYLFRPSLWRGAEIVKVSRSLEVKPASPIGFDFVDIPFEANDFAGYQAEFYAALSDPRAYHAFELPGRLESESFTIQSKAAVQLTDSSTGNESVTYEEGAYTEHRIATAGGAFIPKVLYRSSRTGKLDIAVDGKEAVSISLSPASEWAVALLPPVTLETGEHVMRITISSGSSTLDAIEFLPL